MNKPNILYRGARENVGVIDPAKIIDSERHRFPSGAEAVVFASAYKQEALAYAIASRRGWGGFSLYPYYKNEEKEIGWKLELPFTKDSIPEEKAYLYELNPENFEQNSEGEFYSLTSETPTKVTEYSIEEALREFDEVVFRDKEGVVEGEGGGAMMR